MKKKFLATAVLVAIVALITACSSVSFTHANGKSGQNITNAEVQKDNTVVLTYPNGTACIDTNPGESQTCKGQ
jgi:ABC-type glycerol-3-phosphate transport system substrate-binding protein